jgi:hypothetical protein
MKTPLEKLIDFMNESIQNEIKILEESEKHHAFDVRQASIIYSTTLRIIKEAERINKKTKEGVTV